MVATVVAPAPATADPPAAVTPAPSSAVMAATEATVDETLIHLVRLRTLLYLMTRAGLWEAILGGTGEGFWPVVGQLISSNLPSRVPTWAWPVPV